MMKFNIAIITIVLLSSTVLVSCRKKKIWTLYYDDLSSVSSYSDYSDLFSSYHDDSDKDDSDYSYSDDKKHKKKHSSDATMVAMFLPITAAHTNYRQMVGSQLSATISLGKLVFGASGTTKNELLSALGFRSEGDVAGYFKKLLNDLESLQGVHLEIGSRIYMSDRFRLNRNYKAKVDEVFRSSCEVVNMKNPSMVASTINWWVDDKTRGRIKELVTAESIDPSSSLIIVNAIYFSGKWKYPFKYEVTEVFYGFNAARSIPMMSVTSFYNYGMSKILNAAVIEIPYKGSEASMVVILPHKTNGLQLVLSRIKEASGKLEKLVRLEKKEVEVTIPKFKIETQLDLGAIYKQVGVKQAFSSKAKLTGIAEKSRDRVFISQAVQKAVIEVNEIGTKAAAASAAQAIPISHREKFYFKATRPFVFIIVAKKYQLFSGVYS